MTITEKIRALLAKAASTDSQAEAEAFLGKAHELLEKHQLDINDLEHDDPIDGETLTSQKTTASPDWHFQLMFAVAKYFGCEGCQSWGGRNVGWEMKVIGRESARVTAKEMHSYLVKTVRRLGRENAGRMGLPIDTASRRIGRALEARLWALAPKTPEASTAAGKNALEASTAAGKNALVTLDAVRAKYLELFPKARPLGGQGTLTTKTARELAGGIGLNHQMGANGTLRLK